MSTKKDLAKIANIQHATKHSTAVLRRRTTAKSYKSMSQSSEKSAEDNFVPEQGTLPPVEDGDDDVFENQEKEEEEEAEEGEERHPRTLSVRTTSQRTTSGGSGGDSKSSYRDEEDEEDEGEGKEASDEVIKHTFKKFTTELDIKKLKPRSPTPPGKKREELLEKYHALLKEKKELRKRNAQAQTNICQYLRKHNIDLFPHLEADKSQVALRDEYNDMLDRIEDLADLKDDESEQFDRHMEEINGKKNLLQNEISRLNTEMGNVKIRTVNQPPLDKPSENVMSQKEVVDNIKLLEKIEEEMHPVRLEYVQLKRGLDAIQIKYDNILYEHEEDLDQTELTVENQVLSDKMLETDEELSRMKHVMNNDVVVLTHVKMKHTQIEAKNTKMFMDAQSGAHKIKQLKIEEFKLKAMLKELEEKYRKLEENIGLLGNKALLKDYSNTFIDLDKAQGRVELEIPLSPKSRKKKKITKVA